MPSWEEEGQAMSFKRINIHNVGHRGQINEIGLSLAYITSRLEYGFHNNQIVVNRVTLQALDIS